MSENNTVLGSQFSVFSFAPRLPAIWYRGPVTGMKSATLLMIRCTEFRRRSWENERICFAAQQACASRFCFWPFTRSQQLEAGGLVAKLCRERNHIAHSNHTTRYCRIE